MFDVAAGPVPVDVDDRRSAAEALATCTSTPAQTQQITWPMPPGLPYEKEVAGRPALERLRSSTRGGFTPIFFDPNATDARYLGVRIKPMLETRPQ